MGTVVLNSSFSDLDRGESILLESLDIVFPNSQTWEAFRALVNGFRVSRTPEIGKTKKRFRSVEIAE